MTSLILISTRTSQLIPQYLMDFPSSPFSNSHEQPNAGLAGTCAEGCWPGPERATGPDSETAA